MTPLAEGKSEKYKYTGGAVEDLTEDKLNDFIKRARMAKIHAFIIANLKDDMPKLFGKGRKKKELIKNLPTLLKKIQVGGEQ